MDGMNDMEDDFDFDESSESEQEIPDFTPWIKGFNEGYYIAKYMPELSLLLATAKGEGKHFDGLRSGRSQYMMDKVKENLSWLHIRPDDNRLVAERGEYPPLNFDDRDEDLEPDLGD